MNALAMKADGLPELTMHRTYAAPPELLFSMWTQPEHIMRWWAPHDFTVPYAEFDVRPGGKLRIDFRARDGFTFANYGEVKEVKPHERLVFTAEYRENEKLMVVSLITVTFKAHEGGTKMTVHADVTFAEQEAANSLAGMEQGWSEQMEKLDTLLETMGGGVG
jgi:uncharacterized protein YndB with AHSA1/START domain